MVMLPPAVTFTFDPKIYEPKYICDQNWLKFPPLAFEIITVFTNIGAGNLDLGGCSPRGSEEQSPVVESTAEAPVR